MAPNSHVEDGILGSSGYFHADAQAQAAGDQVANASTAGDNTALIIKFADAVSHPAAGEPMRHAG